MSVDIKCLSLDPPFKADLTPNESQGSRSCASETLCFAMWTPKLLNSASQKGPDFFHWTP